ncbi:MAG: DUF6798 domain-containing protein [Candidatus Omnitrophota bacterium]
MAFFLLGIFLLTNGYTYGWDDQHLEIPLLKSLIDPSLYAGDYYVESLKKHFSSLLFPLLANIITVEQIPSTYLMLYLLCRYLFFFWILKLWTHVSKSRLTGVLCVIMLILLGRVEEFLYRTFSHQEFALAFIMGGIYFFYKNRFTWAAAIFGLSANIHSLYSLFPFLYLLVFLTQHFSRYGGRTILKASLAFLLSLSPLLIWMKTGHISPSAGPSPGTREWLELYHLACPQNFLFQNADLAEMSKHISVFLEATAPYWAILGLYYLNLYYNPLFRRDKKVKAILLTAFISLLVSFTFTYIFPTRFILDLNLVRHTQFLLFFLWGYTAILFVHLVQTAPPLTILAFSVCVPLLRFGEYVTLWTTILIMGFLSLPGLAEAGKGSRARTVLSLSAIALSIAGLLFLFLRHHYSPAVLMNVIGTWGLILVNFLILILIRPREWVLRLKALFIIIPFMLLIGHFTVYHYQRLQTERTGTGFWQLQRNWEDMQKYVRDHTPKNSLLLVPYNMTMGGFRILSERKIICSYRDCGIVGFDYQAAREWQKRVSHIEPFKVMATNDITPAIQNALLRYRVNYIVFMNYNAPPANPILQPVYQNDVFSLYKVLINPL